jgi:uncharacterized membrane protein YqjE
LSADGGGPNTPPNLGQAIADVSEKASLLVREEIELAKAEIGQKLTRLSKGAVVAAAAAVFAILGLIMLLHTVAWFLSWALGEVNAIFWGYLITTAILFVFAGIAGLIGIRWIKRGAPPKPDMAIEEARLIRETVKS